MTSDSRSPQDASLSGMPCGYHGRVLEVDATRGTGQYQSLEAETLRQFLGGVGLGAALLLRRESATVDALAPEAPLVFAFSPLVGSPLTTSAKFAVVSKSPLTERLNDSLASSTFALAGKRCGCDAIVMTGRAPMQSVLVIDEGQVRLERADDLRGQTCRATEEALQRRLGSGFACAVIGPAGENLVRFATISHDGRHAGRGGSGAVLGAKNIKAIAVRGSCQVAWARPEALWSSATALSRRSFGPATAKYRELGTASNLLLFNRLHALPTRNFQAGQFDDVLALAPETLAAVRSRTRRSCAGCTIGCEHLYAPREDGREDPDRPTRLEYENLFALGPLCGISDADVVLAASRRCDELGMDTISAGGTIAFAMEAAERGLLDAGQLRFGNTDLLLPLLDQIAGREALGARLADGSRRLAGEIGHDALAFAPQVKGLEIPGYEPRALQTMALGFAVGTRGADHNRSGAYEVDFSDQINRRHPPLDAARLAVGTEDRAALMDSLILCKFLRGVFADFYGEAAALLGDVTGWELTAEELAVTARRIVTARKLFNIRAGWQPSEDTLPTRFLQTALPDDPQAALAPTRLDALKAAYYETRGWTPEGWIPTSRLAELSL